jgi:hypothetical protein
MRKVIFDIGTHKAEELRVLNGDRCYILSSYLCWWFDWCKRLIKIVVQHHSTTAYGIGNYQVSPLTFGFSNHLRIITHLITGRNMLRHFHIICVDPATNITPAYLPKLHELREIIFLPYAILPHTNTKNYELIKFYVEKDSLSSSLFASRSYQKVVVCPAISFKELLSELLRQSILQDGDEILLRLNCEGAELGIFKDIVAAGFKPLMVVGSINDVFKKFGNQVSDEMFNLIADNGIKFDYFKGSDPSTWPVILDKFESLEG